MYRHSKQVIALNRCVLRNCINLNCSSNYGQHQWLRQLSSLPSHKIVPMPALSPTMETGSIAKWNLKEGDKFEPGTSLCDVETDKATVSFDAQNDGYLAKILISTGDIKVGQPLMVTVDEQADVAAFANFTADSVTTTSSSAPAPPTPAAVAAASTPVASSSSSNSNNNNSRIFASPLAKTLIKQAQDTLPRVSAVLGSGGSGPNGRIVAADVIKAFQLSPPGSAVPSQATATTAVPTTAAIAPPATAATTTATIASDISGLSIIDRLTQSKMTIPHYALSVELNLTKLMALRERLLAKNSKGKKGEDNSNSLGVLDFLVKAAASAMRSVPDVNGSWQQVNATTSAVRRYEQVDINIVTADIDEEVAGSSYHVIRDVHSKGLTAIHDEISLMGSGNTTAGATTSMGEGTFAIHPLGVFGIRNATPIILPPQAAALAFGTVIDTLVPGEKAEEYDVAPIMIATLVCDHRVVDGAVSAQWLQAYKQLVEDPLTLIL